MDLIFVIILGALWGSFANVCIIRMPQGKGVVVGRSFCVKCNKKIQWFDNIPIISYLLLKFKCRNCKTKISFQYFLVESISLINFLVLYLIFGISLTTLLLIILSVVFLIIFFIDLKYLIIPDILNFSLIFLGLLKNFIPTKNLNFNYDIEQSIIGGIVGYLTIWIIIFLYKKLKNLDAMGLGDAKLMAAIGTFFGLKSIPLILFFSSITALLIVLPSLINKTRNLKAEIPFGPYILISAVFYYFYGDKIYQILLI